MMEYSIQHLPLEERPRERLFRLGAESLSTVELLAILFGSGTKTQSVLQLSHELLKRFGSIQQLAEASIVELMEIKGIGQAKAIQLKAALCLGTRASRETIHPKYRIQHPSHAYHLIRDQIEHEKREHFIVILQDTKGYLISQEVVSVGSLAQALVHPREVFYPAIRHKAASMIVAHNHPSGDPTPSEQDIALTQVLIESGRLLQIPVQDHLILGKNAYISLRQLKLCDF